jgi:hypothetical protein
MELASSPNVLRYPVLFDTLDCLPNPTCTLNIFSAPCPLRVLLNYISLPNTKTCQNIFSILFLFICYRPDHHPIPPTPSPLPRGGFQGASPFNPGAMINTAQDLSYQNFRNIQNISVNAQYFSPLQFIITHCPLFIKCHKIYLQHSENFDK